VKQLEEAIKTIIKRHAILRTTYEFIAGEPVQRVHKDVEFKLYRVEAEKDIKVKNKKELDEKTKQEIGTLISNAIIPFELTQPPLFRVTLIKLNREAHIILFDMHHIMSDQASKRIFMQEFTALLKKETLPPLQLQYRDYSQWQNNKTEAAALRKQERYWWGEYDGSQPILNLPLDFERPEEKSYAGSSLSFKIEESHLAQLKQLALKERTTMFAIMLTIYYVFLSKISGQQDIITGIPVIGRSHNGLDKMLGMFVNTLALRNYPEPEKTFKEFLTDVKQRTTTAFENQDYQFEDLVNHVVKNRDPARNPLFDVFFAYSYPEPVRKEQEIAGMKIYTLDEFTDDASEKGVALTMFDMCLQLMDTGDNLLVTLLYWERLFKEETIQRFCEYYQEIVTAVAGNTGIKLKEIKISHDLGVAQSTV
ncbi:MAG: non-ribosomal peptide synthetase, partial [bacterium]|nr:non-ribosomal peptide synthetase [bacterium]